MLNWSDDHLVISPMHARFLTPARALIRPHACHRLCIDGEIGGCRRATTWVINDMAMRAQWSRDSNGLFRGRLNPPCDRSIPRGMERFGSLLPQARPGWLEVPRQAAQGAKSRNHLQRHMTSAQKKKPSATQILRGTCRGCREHFPGGLRCTTRLVRVTHKQGGWDGCLSHAARLPGSDSPKIPFLLWLFFFG